MPYNGGLYGIKVGENQGISTENMAYGPPKYGIRNPHFMPHEPFLWGVGVVFDLLREMIRRANPKNLLRLFFRNNLARQKITSKNKNNLARLFLRLFYRVFSEGF